MNVRPIMRLAIPVLLVGCMGDAAAQSSRQRDTVQVATYMDDSTGYDRPYAVVFAGGQPLEGAVLWSCGEGADRFVSAVRLGEEGADGATRRMAWSVDGGAPVTTVVRGVPGKRVWFLDDEDATALAERARTAARMEIRLSREGAAGQEVAYTYSLAGADSALHRLACARDAEIAALPAGRQVLLELSAEPFRRRDGRMEFQPRPNGYHPRLLNEGELLTFLEHHFPKGPREEGRSGEIRLRMRVQADGRVEPGSVRVIRTDDPRYVAAIAGALDILRFRPARRNGQAASVWVTLPIVFQTRR